MSYAHKMNSMYEHSSCMIFVLSYMINVDHSLYHDPENGHDGRTNSVKLGDGEG